MVKKITVDKITDIGYTKGGQKMRYYLADTWNDGDNNFCYLVTISTTKGAKVLLCQVYGDKFVIEDDVTEAVSNVVPIAEMFECCHEVEAKNIYKRVSREEIMPRKKEYDRAVLIRMSQEQHEKLKKIANAKGKGIADIVRDYIQRAKCPK